MLISALCLLTGKQYLKMTAFFDFHSEGFFIKSLGLHPETRTRLTPHFPGAPACSSKQTYIRGNTIGAILLFISTASLTYSSQGVLLIIFRGTGISNIILMCNYYLCPFLLRNKRLMI